MTLAERTMLGWDKVVVPRHYVVVVVVQGGLGLSEITTTTT